MRAACLALFVLLFSAPAEAQKSAASRLQDRVIASHAQLHLPATAEGIGRTLTEIARDANLLIGFETLADYRDLTPVMIEPSGSLKGRTVAEVLDSLVGLDDRYAWREIDGVIHVRPKTAFDDPGHFLHRRVKEFRLEKAVPLEATFAIHRIFRPDCRLGHVIYTEGRDEYLAGVSLQEQVLTSVHLKNATVIQIMDAVIKKHGQLYWNVTYAKGPARYEHAIFAFGIMISPGGWWRMCAGDENLPPIP